MTQPDDLVRRIRREFVLGGHKAAAIAALLRSASICSSSRTCRDDVVVGMHMTPFATVDEAVAAALARCGDGARVLRRAAREPRHDVERGVTARRPRHTRWRLR